MEPRRLFHGPCCSAICIFPRHSVVLGTLQKRRHPGVLGGPQGSRISLLYMLLLLFLLLLFNRCRHAELVSASTACVVAAAVST